MSKRRSQVSFHCVRCKQDTPLAVARPWGRVCTVGALSAALLLSAGAVAAVAPSMAVAQPVAASSAQSLVDAILQGKQVSASDFAAALAEVQVRESAARAAADQARQARDTAMAQRDAAKERSAKADAAVHVAKQAVESATPAPSEDEVASARQESDAAIAAAAPFEQKVAQEQSAYDVARAQQTERIREVEEAGKTYEALQLKLGEIDARFAAATMKEERDKIRKEYFETNAEVLKARERLTQLSQGEDIATMLVEPGKKLDAAKAELMPHARVRDEKRSAYESKKAAREALLQAEAALERASAEQVTATQELTEAQELLDQQEAALKTAVSSHEAAVSQLQSVRDAESHAVIPQSGQGNRSGSTDKTRVAHERSVRAGDGATLPQTGDASAMQTLALAIPGVVAAVGGIGARLRRRGRSIQ